jgi:hypothetical protein
MRQHFLYGQGHLLIFLIDTTDDAVGGHIFKVPVA